MHPFVQTELLGSFQMTAKISWILWFF